jgi:hypothetical protein
LARGQLQEVDAPVHGHDPAIARRRRADELAAESIDPQRAVLRLEVQRRLVAAGSGLELPVEYLEAELGDGRDEGTPAGDPARVELVGEEEGGGRLFRPCAQAVMRRGGRTPS